VRQVALLRQKLAASELENKAWRALAEWGSVQEIQNPSAHDDTPQAAALALATKLGLIDKAGGQDG
jgi:hypothetical protein